MRRFLGPLLVSISAAACQPIITTHGHVPDREALGQVRPGVHDRQSVAQLLGSPSDQASFGGETWYYISRRTEQVAFFREEPVDQQVVIVRFDEAGIVEEVREVGMDEARNIEMVARETPSRGREMGVLEQLFGNLGRFNSDQPR